MLNLAEVVDEAKRLSATHNLTRGHRSFDISSCRHGTHCKGPTLLTFDGNQKKLAEAEGMIVLV
jgi:hypothetical protein